MAGKITEMSKLKQILQLHESGVSNRSIASQLGIYKETVNKYIPVVSVFAIFVENKVFKRIDFTIGLKSLRAKLCQLWTSASMIFPSAYPIWKRNLDVNM